MILINFVHPFLSYFFTSVLIFSHLSLSLPNVSCLLITHKIFTSKSPLAHTSRLLRCDEVCSSWDSLLAFSRISCFFSHLVIHITLLLNHRGLFHSLGEGDCFSHEHKIEVKLFTMYLQYLLKHNMSHVVKSFARIDCRVVTKRLYVVMIREKELRLCCSVGNLTTDMTCFVCIRK